MSEINNPLYKQIITKSASLQPNPEGLTDYQPPGKSDQIIIKQNNTIILLLLEINNNLEKLIKEKTTIDTPKLSEIDELVNQLKRIEITPQKDRIIKKTKEPWKFFKINEEAPPKTIPKTT